MQAAQAQAYESRQKKAIRYSLVGRFLRPHSFWAAVLAKPHTRQPAAWLAVGCCFFIGHKTVTLPFLLTVSRSVDPQSQHVAGHSLAATFSKTAGNFVVVVRHFDCFLVPESPVP